MRRQDFEHIEDATPENPEERDYISLPEIGWPEVKFSPRYILDEEDFALGMLWQEWRPGMSGRGHLPFSGGVAEQPAIVMEALSIIEQAARLLERKPDPT